MASCLFSAKPSPQPMLAYGQRDTCMKKFCEIGILTIFIQKLEQLEHLRSEDTPRRLMITHIIESCWIPQVKTRTNDLEDIGQGQSHDVQHISSC